MRYAVKYTIAASLVAGAVAVAQPHQHQGHHAFHAKKSVVDKRTVVTEVVDGGIETVYQLGGELIDTDRAELGIKKGDFVVIGQSTPVAPAPVAPAPVVADSAPSSSSSSSDGKLGAQFVETPESSTTSIVVPTSVASTTSSASATPTKAAPSTDDDESNTSGGEGLDAPFPNNKIECSNFPSKYGAVGLSWLNLGSGWAGVQRVPGFSMSASSIIQIDTGIAGDDCEAGAMCQYACPPGYYSTQYPEAQGSRGESIGGLYCNSNGLLEITRSEYKTLCKRGEGGVKIHNTLSQVVATCQTVYPGTEAMVIPTLAQPGSTVDLCNVPQSNFIYKGGKTSAQYYVNKAGYTNADACVWNSKKDPLGAGNWAPIVLGVGKDGQNTYLSIFKNKPTSDAELDFNIEIKGTGNVVGSCKLEGGSFSSGGDGCTVTLGPGGSAVFEFS